MGRNGLDAQIVFGEEIDDLTDVALKVFPERQQPRSPFRVGGDGRDKAGDRSLIELGIPELLQIGFPQRLVGDDTVSGHRHSSQVERLGRAGENKSDGCRIGTDTAKRGVLVSGECEVPVNLIGDDHHPLLTTEGGYPPERITVPDDASGIVGIAKDENLGIAIGEYPF